MSVSRPSKEHAALFWPRLYAWLARTLDDQKPKGAIAALDGVRAGAFLIVLWYHMSLTFKVTGLWQMGHFRVIDAIIAVGNSGVTLFFLLSGFLLFLPYARALLFNTPWPEAKIFYIRRIFRIFPGYFFILFLLVILKEPFLLSRHHWRELFPFLTFTMDFSNSQALDGPLWTLAVECQYYLLLPWLALALLGLTRLVRPAQRLWMVLGGLVVVIGWGVALTFLANPPVTLPISPATFGTSFVVVYGEKGKFPEDFAVGMVIAVLYVFLTTAPGKEKYLRVIQRLVPVIGLCVVGGFLYTALRLYSQVKAYSWPVLPGLFHLFPWHFDQEIDLALCYGGVMLMALFARPGGWIRQGLEWTPLRWLGMLSFSLYLWHLVFIQVIREDVIPDLHGLNHYVAMAVAWLVAIGLIFPFCFLSYVIIEKPGMRLSEQIRRHLQATKQGQRSNRSPTSLAETLVTEPTPIVQTQTSAEHEGLRDHSSTWGSMGLNLDRATRRPVTGLSPPTNRLAKQKHRLQPFPAPEFPIREE